MTMIENSSSQLRRYHRAACVICTVLCALTIASLMSFTNAAVQCNVGLKMFSLESGNTICAPMPTHFNCIESCEWNSSCTLTSHYAAFRGRRTYVAGMVLTASTFIVQCCASLGTIVEMNTRKEPKCVWVPTIETVEERGNIRFDPPLASNEYLRDIIAERQENGRVNLRVQICKFTVQRLNCTKEKMTQEDAVFHTLLLLRLSRTKEQLYHGKISNLSNVSDQFRDEKPLEISLKQSSPQLAPRLQSPMIQKSASNPLHIPDTSATALISEASVTTPIVFHSPGLNANRSAFFPKTMLQFLPDSGINHQQRPYPDQPLSSDNNSKLVGSNNTNDDAATLPHHHTLRLLKYLRQLNAEAKYTKVSNAKSMVLNDDPISLASPPYNVKGRQTYYSPAESKVAASNKWQQNWPISLQNVTQNQELEHTTYLQKLAHKRQQLEQSVRENSLGDNRTIVYPNLTRNDRFGLARVQRKMPILESDKLELKEEFQTEKTAIPLRSQHQHVFHVSTPEYVFPTIERKPSFEQREENRYKNYYTRDFPSSNFNSGIVETLSRESNVKVQPSIRSTQSPVLRRPFLSLSHRQRQLRIQKLWHEKHRHQQQRQMLQQQQHNNNRLKTNVLRPNYRHIATFNQREQKISEELQNKANLAAKNREKSSVVALSGLVNCCQQQAPGCKHLCSKDVSKEEIKHALVTQQCPPLSMTSVIQCFPRYYNITSVTQCCNANSQRQVSGAFAPTHVTGSRLPDQCLGLCAPDFKLSFAHFACIDHISTIVECYRDLLQ